MDPDEALTAAIMDGLSRWKRSDQWNRDGDRFIPYAATWLNGSRWEDEVTPYKPRAQVAAQNYSQRTYDDAGADDHMIQRMEQVLALARGGGA